MSSDDDLSALFPNLRPVLDQWGQPTNASGYAPEGSAVSAEQVDAYLSNLISQRMRPGPNPVVNASQPSGPQFQAGTSAPPPPAAHVESDDRGAPAEQVPGRAEGQPTAQPAPAPAPAPASTEPEGQGTQPPSSTVPPVQPEGTDTPTSEPPAPLSIEEIDVDGAKIAKERVKAFLEFDQMLQNDPQLQQVIATYLSGPQYSPQAWAQQQIAPPPPASPTAVPTSYPPQFQQPSAPQPTPQPTAPPAPPAPSLPSFQVPAEYADDPAFVAMKQFFDQQNSIMAQQATTIAQLQQQAEYNNSIVQARQRAETEGLVGSTVKQFQTERNLTDDQMKTLQEAAARLEILPAYMKGVDPLTGVPVRPDPVAAVTRALEAAYYQMPEFREAELQRISQQRAADDERKAKATAVSGSSGSVTRTASLPTDPTERRSALLTEVGQMMNGTWTGEN